MTKMRHLKITALFALWFLLCLTARAQSIDPLAAVEKARLSGDHKLEMQLLETLVQGAEQNNPVAQFKYACLLGNQRRYAEAREHCQRALKLAPAHHWVADSARNELNNLKEQPLIVSSRTKGGRMGYIGLFFHNQRITRVLPDSPADHAHIAAGDLIFSSDGVAAAGQSDEALSKRMLGLEGTPMRLVIDRAGKKYACTIFRGHAIDNDSNGPKEIQAVPPMP